MLFILCLHLKKCQVQSQNTAPSEIARVDIIIGSDHGAGAFIAGARIIVVLSNESFSFELVTAEIICRKDNSEILALTVNNLLSSALTSLST